MTVTKFDRTPLPSFFGFWRLTTPPQWTACCVVSGLVVASCCLMPAAAWAGQGPSIDWEQLNLNSDQKTHIQDLDSQWKSIYNQLAPNIRQKEAKLLQMMNNPHSNEAEIMKLQNEINQDKIELKQQATELFLSKRKCLKPEQKKRLMEMVQTGKP